MSDFCITPGLLLAENGFSRASHPEKVVSQAELNLATVLYLSFRKAIKASFASDPCCASRVPYASPYLPPSTLPPAHDSSLSTKYPTQYGSSLVLRALFLT